MADQKISELTNITGANLANADEFVVVDTSADQTKAVTRAEFFKNTPPIDVNGTVTADGLTVDGGPTSTIRISGVGQDSNEFSSLEFYNNDGSGDGPQVAGKISMTGNASGYRSSLDFYTADSLTGVEGAGPTLRMKALYNGDIAFYEDTGTTPKFYWDSSAESLGIGNSAPATALDVTGTVTADGLTVDGDGSFSGTVPRLTLFETDLTDGNAQFLLQTRELRLGSVTDAGASFTDRFKVNVVTGDVSFYEDTGTTPKFFWDASAESLGIGTTSPIGKLDVSDGSNPLSIDSSTYNEIQSYNRPLLLNRQGNNVGIGTSSPASPLHVETVSGTDAITISRPTFGEAGVIREAGGALAIESQKNLTLEADVDGLFTSASSNIIMKTDGSEAMRITSSGNVGIGTSSPASIVGGTDTSPVLSIGGSDSTLTNGDKAGSVSFITNDGSYVTTFPDGVTGEIASIAETSLGAAYGMAFYTGTTGGSDRGERMRIDRLGNVGIGTATPAVDLHIQQAGTPTLRIEDSSDGSYGQIFVGGNVMSIDADQGNTSAASLMRFRVDGAEAMRITSAGSVGIGTNSPTSGRKLHVFDDGDANVKVETTTAAGDARLELTSDSAGVSQIRFGDEVSANTGLLTYDHTADSMAFTVNASERLRIDSSGNVIMGKTVADNTTEGFTFYGEADGVSIVKASGEPLILNRLTNDGSILTLRKDGTPVGSIGTDGGNFYIDGGTNISGLHFRGADILPRDNGALDSADTISLGNTGYRFKDLYLSGGVYLGGTGAANKLDDYEEGTWTPVLSGYTGMGYTRQDGKYTKIGNLVIAEFQIDISSTGTYSGNTRLTGFPFPASNAITQNVGQVRLGLASATTINANSTSLYMGLYSNSDQAFLYSQAGGTYNGNVWQAGVFAGTAVYRTNS